MDERDKALYAQHDSGVKDLERWVLKRDKTAYAQHDQRIRILQSTARERLRTAWQGGGRGRRECRHDASAAVIVLFHKHSLLRLLPGRGGGAGCVLQGGEIE